MKNVDLAEYRPGKGFKVRQYLGSGAWKSAFRGSAESSVEDIALLCYHSGTSDDAANDLKQLLRLDPGAGYSEHLPSFYQVFRGTDGRMWIAEELLARSLSQLTPLGDTVSVARLGRDLAKGLACIHGQNLVHRDIKLDNCGVDRFGRGKIFDLGSLVTDPGDVACTILTRPPELLRNETQVFSSASDVWALGATLFALSTGDYPFVTASEVRARSALNERIALAEHEEEKRSAQEQKEELDSLIVGRATAVGAETTLLQRVQSRFGNGVGELLAGMLSFSPSERGTSRDLVDSWSLVAASLGRPAGSPRQVENWERIAKALKLAAKREITVTSMQLERTAAEWKKARRSKSLVDRVGDLQTLIEDVRRTLNSTGQAIS